MKKSLFYILFFLLIPTACQHNGDLMIEDFESGSFQDWIIEGDAFGQVPAEGSLAGEQEVIGFQGKYLANSFHNGDDSRGILTSKPFRIERDFINFLIGGGNSSDTYIELLIGEQSIYKTHSPVESETLQLMSWDVKTYKGQQATLRIVDNQRGSWGHILIDAIEQSNLFKSNIMENYTLTYNISQKYLLLPIEDSAPETKVQLLVEGKEMGAPMDIRLAKTHIQYWLPLPVASYQGKKISLVFRQVTKGDMGIHQIKPSNTFDYNYKESYRSCYHFTPEYGWMNDPNGMVYHNGEYHLFYQYNPYGARWGNMHWGHAISEDMMHWKQLPVALSPDSLGAIFSGSAVIDRNNSAGFGENAMIAFYTSAGAQQSQSIAYSLDNGRTFVKYTHNPVIPNPNIQDFRDPKVFWYDPQKKWIMSLATSQTITFYTSKNLKQWEKLSEFGQNIGAHTGVWECPDLFPLTYKGQKKWILFVSINPGGPNGGNATQYFIGDFDGTTFTPDPLPYPLWIDYGRDNYAGVTWSNIPESDGRRIFLGWMNNWDYGNSVPTQNFRSAMTLPRELRLADNGQHLVVASFPVQEVGEERDSNPVIINKLTENPLPISADFYNNGYVVSFTVKLNTLKSFSFSLQNSKGEKIVYSFDTTEKTFVVDRSQSGLTNFSGNFAEPLIKAPLTPKESYTIHLWVDKASTEVFVNGGEVVQTNIAFPTEPYNQLWFNLRGNTDVSIENITLYKIKN
ncbi:GH32 C-terminal domain-containing protein [Capnocytophaga sp. oral taxon 338]|uniref:GH32 C-terminal domain-containing protein n=1 Tax=Capnocytophaga sp. oral taxon 338 TaxID=710239 RepID=UPI000202E4F9|nr:GH32 C-terminal domain-containing protein [Capnocytophaga sp. oral taxon 338]EGD33238.1 levanase [Capnocytophaga sp. oral taxon 338 str. F0234]